MVPQTRAVSHWPTNIHFHAFNGLIQNPSLRTGRGPGPCKCTPLPKKGYFSLADTKKEVYPARQREDPLKKGDRYSPEFIWNSDWQSEMDSQEEKERQRKEVKEKKAKKTTGFLSFSRLTDMNDVSVDMTKELEKSQKEIARRKEAAEVAATSTPLEDKKKKPLVPSTREYKTWARQERFSTQISSVPDIEGYEPDPEAMAEYEEEKIQVQIWTLGLIAFCFGCVNQFYSQDIAISYLVGAIGGLWYLRLLNKGVDTVGTPDAGGLIAQPRLLIPAILVLGFNRWNELAADKVGVTIQLLPMLAGFFTYKGALIVRQSMQLASSILEDMKKEN